MAYIGFLKLTELYRQQRSDENFKLMQISDNLVEAASKSSSISQDFELAKSQLSQDDPNYSDCLQALTEQYNNDLDEVATWEAELEHQKDSCETKVKLLDGYITAFESAAKQGISKDHTYGNQGG